MNSGPSIAARAMVGLLAALWLLAPAASAQEDRTANSFSSDWTLLAGYQDGSQALMVLPSGAIVSRSSTAMYRSDDDGDTWTMLPNPPDGVAIAADPVDSQVLYAFGMAGLERSPDGGATWQQIRAASNPPPATAAPFAISSDHRQLFLAEANQDIQHSPDAGASWQQIYQVSQSGSPCMPTITMLIPHPTDGQRLMTDAGCYAGRDFGHGLQQTRDGGRTWSQFFPTAQEVNPCTLVGGQGSQANRWYLVGNPFAPGVPAALLRSDDDGATWNQVLQTESAVQRLCAVAYDPTNPDTVWVAAGQTPDPTLTGVRASSDAGRTWSYLGRQDIGWVNALARAADGSVLLAATNEGIWRLSF